MKFKQYENGSCDIEFSWKERFILLKKGKLHLPEESFEHFGNNLMRMVVEWKMKKNSQNITTYKDTEIKTN
jgi:hypothetical protein